MVTGDDLARALADDLDGNFERLIDVYQHRLYAFALRLAGDAREAEEIAQDAFVRAYRALGAYPTERRRTLALRPWLYQIALNVARNRFRVRRPPTVSLSPAPNGEVIDLRAGSASDPSAQALARERRDALARCLADLPLRYRAAVVLRHVEGLSYAEVAVALAIPIGTAKANVHRGVRLLRAALTDTDLAPADPIPLHRTGTVRHKEASS
ncbi:MAG: sigma-70 family RNA polymerase sigma factor [Chloroflexi bacterium]|nr:sigma-70 family RNA polymerase sigma factor [Chloroflexota bacterium]